jgi:ribonuclease HI
MTQGIVLYTDGGCRPNPGPGGWGMHGYVYLDEEPKKGSGNPDHVLTDKGYYTKIQFEMNTTAGKLITPVHYVDGFGTFAADITNNVAELAGAINGLTYALDYDLRRVLIITDSEYVRKGLDEWSHGWQRNNWIKSDGSEVPNMKYWKELIALRDQLVARGVEVTINWIKGHDDFLGNEKADKLATIAVLTSRRLGETNTHIVSSKAEGYWNYTPPRHPFINHRRMYFNTLAEFNNPGEYYLGDHGKEDEMLGKRISDGAFAVVYVAEPDPILEMIRDYQATLAQGEDSLLAARLDHIYRPETHKQLSQYGTRAVEQPNAYRYDLIALDREPLTRELRPPKIAMRAVDELSTLAEKLKLFLVKDPSVVVTDLTTILYESTLKVPKKGEPTTEMKLKGDYNVGFAKLEVDANYQSGPDLTTASVILTLGLDILDRNALKRLEDKNPTVSLITWAESPTMFRYATIVEAEGDRGIWAGVYSNLRVIT